MCTQQCFPSVLQLLFLSRNFARPRRIEGRVSFAQTVKRNSNPLIRQSFANLRRFFLRQIFCDHFKRTETPWKPETRWNVRNCENLKSGKIGEFDTGWKNFNCREYCTCVWSTQLSDGLLAYLALTHTIIVSEITNSSKPSPSHFKRTETLLSNHKNRGNIWKAEIMPEFDTRSNNLNFHEFSISLSNTQQPSDLTVRRISS